MAATAEVSTPPTTADEPKAEGTAAKSVIALNHFKHALRVVGAAIQSRTTISILGCVRIEQLPAGLAIEATSLDVYIRALVPESSGPSKAVIMPAEKLLNWVKLLSAPDGEARGDVKISATRARATLLCGRSRVVIPVLDASNWPDNGILETKGDGITLKQGALARGLRFATIAVSDDASRYTLSGVLLAGDGTTLKLVATNGHCMMVYSIPCEERISLLLPSILVKALLPWLGDAAEGVDLTYSDKAILAAIAAPSPVSVASPKMAGSFPQWETVVPVDKRVEVTVAAADLLAALNRSALLADERSGLVVFNFSDKILLKSASVSSGESEETVDCIGAPETPLKIGINSEYVINLLSRLEGEVTIALPKDGQTPLVFKATPAEGETLTYIVMPMRA
jgi:DNA polymerase-3 subunit beta